MVLVGPNPIQLSRVIAWRGRGEVPFAHCDGETRLVVTIPENKAGTEFVDTDLRNLLEKFKENHLNYFNLQVRTGRNKQLKAYPAI